MAIERILCPSCGAAKFERDAQGNLICSYCGALYKAAGDEILCRVCGTLNPPQAQRCMICGVLLGRQCPACTYINPPNAEHCEECGTPLDTLASIITRAREIGEDSAVIRGERLTATKHADLAYMYEQRTRLEAEERERLARLGFQRLLAERQQRLLVTLVLSGLILLLGIGCVAALIYWLF